MLGLVRRELAPYATRANNEINGPDVILKAEAGQAMGMVLHELDTNAANHGALSTQNGRVAIRWERRLNGHRRSHLVFEWREIGGPSVAIPKSSGFGTSTIRDLIPYELVARLTLRSLRRGSSAALNFRPIGLPKMMGVFQTPHMPGASTTCPSITGEGPREGCTSWRRSSWSFASWWGARRPRKYHWERVGGRVVRPLRPLASLCRPRCSSFVGPWTRLGHDRHGSSKQQETKRPGLFKATCGRIDYKQHLIDKSTCPDLRMLLPVD